MRDRGAFGWIARTVADGPGPGRRRPGTERTRYPRAPRRSFSQAEDGAGPSAGCTSATPASKNVSQDHEFVGPRDLESAPVAHETGRIAPADITEQVVSSFSGASDARLRELMQALVRHLHDFAAEVGLTQEEWRSAVEALTETGRITDDRRQEFILWSDTLGLSMLVDALANPLPEGATEST